MSDENSQPPFRCDFEKADCHRVHESGGKRLGGRLHNESGPDERKERAAVPSSAALLSSIQGEVQMSEMVTRRGDIATIKSDLLSVKIA